MTKFHNEIVLDDIIFPTLQILKFTDKSKFIVNNGENLKELHLNYSTNLVNFTITGFCPNLKSLCTDIWVKK